MSVERLCFDTYSPVAGEECLAVNKADVTFSCLQTQVCIGSYVYA